MALVARMAATEVVGRGGGRFVAASEDEPGAQRTEDVPGVGSVYGTPPWLAGSEFVRWDATAQQSEQVVLTAVSPDPNAGDDDPNREWAAASPAGSLTLTIQNPDAFGYVQAGAVYRVTIEKVRGPRSAARQALADEAEQAARASTSGAASTPSPNMPAAEPGKSGPQKPR